MCVNCGLPAHSPSARHPATRLQPIVDADITATVQLDADLAEPDPGGVGNTPGRDEDVAAFDGLLAGVREYGNADPLAGLAVHPEELGRDDNPDPFVAENPPYLIGDVGILWPMSWGPASMMVTSLPKRR